MIRYVLMCLVLLLVGIDLSLTEEVIDPQCKVNCSCCVDQLCGLIKAFDYFENDSCLKGCIDGYKGVRCYIKCAEYCKACSLNFNNCTKCHDGFYNGKYKNCSENCASNCKACGKGPDLCTKCHEGFYNGKYKKCSEECPAGCKACKSQESCSECNEGYYNGKEFDFERSTSLYNCTHRCRDTCTRCMSYSNCTGCVRGAFGTICEHECSVGCVNSTCQQSTGNCLCNDSFRGQQCTQCAVGKFGHFCDRQCPLNCKNDICDKVSGNCSNGCITDEFIGRKCNDCVAGKYGTFCNKSCPPNCKGDKCDKANGVCLNGCKENFAGKTCSTGVAGEKVTNTRMVLGFSISTVLLLICIAVLVIILLKRTRPCQRYQQTRHRKQKNQGDVHVKTKVEMTEISASEAKNVQGCGQTSSSEKPYEDYMKKVMPGGSKSIWRLRSRTKIPQATQNIRTSNYAKFKQFDIPFDLK